jgi:hypothetical protein
MIAALVLVCRGARLDSILADTATVAIKGIKLLDEVDGE